MTTRRLHALALCASVLFLAPACEKPDEKKTDKKADDKKAGDEKAEAKKADDAKADAGEAGEAAAVLVIGAAKIMQKDKPEEGLAIAADGSLTVNGEALGKVSADGQVTGADGKPAVKVGADGKVTSADGQEAPVVLTDTGVTMTAGDKTITVVFAEDGSVQFTGAEPPADGSEPPTFVAEGCAGEMAKTCGLVFTMYMLMSTKGPEIEEQPAATAEAVVPE